MTFKLCLLTIASYLFSSIAYSEYISIASGYQYAEHGYLTDDGELKSPTYGGTLDLSDWRIKDKGWLARGPKFSYQEGVDFQRLNGRIPLFHWHKHQGLWLQISQQTQYMEATLSNNVSFLNNSGVTAGISSGSVISAEHLLTQYQLYWLETVAGDAPMNLIGLYYHSETSPATSTINGQTANLFDGDFEGIGLTIGRVKDNKGFNFQWQLNLAKMDMSFSNDVTQHRATSKSESSAYLFDMTLDWHYRYYLAPYWYLVPQLKLGVSTIFQTQTEPEDIKYDSLNYLRGGTWLHLQRRF